MDYTILTRQEYIEFHVKDHNRGRTLSPDDLDMWRLILSSQYDRLLAYQTSQNDIQKLSLDKKIAILASILFLIFGIISTIYIVGKWLVC